MLTTLQELLYGLCKFAIKEYLDLSSSTHTQLFRGVASDSYVRESWVQDDLPIASDQRGNGCRSQVHIPSEWQGEFQSSKGFQKLQHQCQYQV